MQVQSEYWLPFHIFTGSSFCIVNSSIQELVTHAGMVSLSQIHRAWPKVHYGSSSPSESVKKNFF